MQRNPQQALKYKGMFDSGFFRHMTGNKALLIDYQDIGGGFIAFGRSTKGGKIIVLLVVNTAKYKLKLKAVWLDLRSCCWYECSFKCWLITTPQIVINSPCLTDKKELAIPRQTTTGKELSNSLMAGSLPKTTLPTKLVKTVNDEVQIQALVDGKRVNIKESSIRRILRLDDAEGTSCLTNTAIFEGLARMGYEKSSDKLNTLENTMASAIICLATNQKFNFLRYILLSLVKNIEAGVPFFMFLSGEDSLKLKELMDLCTNLSNKVLDLKSEVTDIMSTFKAKIEKLEIRVDSLEEENMVLKELKGVHSTVDFDEPVMEKEKSSKQGRKIADIDADVEINLEKAQAEAYNLDLDHQKKVLSMLDDNDEEPADVKEVLEVVTTAKLITKVVTTARDDANAASVQDTPITTAEATKVTVEVPKPRKKRGVIIQDHDETTTTVTVQPKVQAKDKEKAILIEEPKPLKRQVQIKLDEEVTRQLETELNRKPLTEVQAKRNMIVYLKNMAGYKLNYFKGLSYDEIRSLFKKHYNYNQTFLDEVNEGVKVSEKEVRQEKEVEVESSKREYDDDDVYTDATPLASKIPIVDYKIHTERDRPYFKIIKDDGNHIERFKKTEPKYYSDDYLLNTLKIMFEKPNVEANMYPLTHFTLEQMVNDVRLEIDDESEMSLEPLRLVRRQLNEGSSTELFADLLANLRKQSLQGVLNSRRK
nr:hypothetical protein [Tanacetum cinerariifolium]